MLGHSPGGRYGVPDTRLQAGQRKEALVAGLEQRNRIQRKWRNGIRGRVKARHVGCHRLQACFIPQSFARKGLVGGNQGTEINTLIPFLGVLFALGGTPCLLRNEQSMPRALSVPPQIDDLEGLLLKTLGENGQLNLISRWKAVR